jgi:hypothetical protein
MGDGMGGSLVDEGSAEGGSVVDVVDGTSVA